MEFDNVPLRVDLEDESQPQILRDVIVQLKTVNDPEIPVDIYELGLIYKIEIDKIKGKADVYMTLTAPGCPVAGVMPDWVQAAVENVPEILECEVHMVWDPPWSMEMMSLRAKIELNMI